MTKSELQRMLILAQMKRVGAEGRMGACLGCDRNRAIGASLSCEALLGLVVVFYA